MTRAKDLKYGTPEYRFYRQARRYRMTPEQLTQMLIDQDYCCKICSIDFSNMDIRFTVDHNYECCDSSAVKSTCGECTRFILCHPCNLIVGSLENALGNGTFYKALEYIGYEASYKGPLTN